MKKFIKENWFKLSILLTILIAVLAVVYYFIFLLPGAKNIEALSKNQSTCSQLEEKTLNNYKEQNDPRKQQKQETISSSNHYNTKIKKCIVEISDSIVATYQPNPTIPAKYETITSVIIFDAVENVILASCSYPTPICSDKDGNPMPTSQFDALEKQYMTE